MLGKTMSHYSVSTLIGHGGMREVYQAKDQKLVRDVAIKVLSAEFAKDVGRVARLQTILNYAEQTFRQQNNRLTGSHPEHT